MASVMQQVADRAGVSLTTVSKILNNKDQRFKEQTMREVRQAAKELGYRPNAMAQGLALRRTKTIGVVSDWVRTDTVGNFYSIGVLAGIMAGAANEGYQVLLYTEPWHNTASSSAFFSSSRTDGVILVSPNMNSDAVTGLMSLNMPVVLLSASTDVPGCHFVDINNHLGVSLALDHLWELGHRHIAYIGPRRSTLKDFRERYEAYCAWMREHNLAVPENEIYKEAAGYDFTRVERMQSYLQLPNRPTAIFCVTDYVAGDLIEAASAAGISVPDQLSVVGFDDIPIATMARPKLTTIRQPLREMGLKVVHLLIETIENKLETGDQSVSHIIDPTLIVRGSTGPVYAS